MILQVGVKVLLKDADGKILLVRRSQEKYGKTDGSWDIPGGRIDPGIALIKNLEREVQEETALSMTSVPHLIAAQDILRDGERHIVRLTYTAHAAGELHLDTAENTESRWCTFEELVSTEDLDAYVRELVATKLLTNFSWD